MQIDIKYPLLVRATPEASRKGERYFWGSHTYQADVPEISLDETAIGLGSVVFTSANGERRVYPQMRSYNGHLYRPLGNPQELFSRAHPPRDAAENADYIVSVPPGPLRMGRRPLAEPVREWACWFIDLHGMDTARNWKLWPENERGIGPYLDRNTVEFVDAKLRDVNAADLATAMKMCQAQSQRLLVIDGKYWMETTMPCLTVSASDGTERKARLTMDFLPRCGGSGDWIRFPLSAFAEALEFAQHTAEDLRIDPNNRDFGHVELEELDLVAVGFDYNEEAGHAMALSVGSNLVRRAEQHGFHKLHENSGPLFQGSDLARFETVRAAILGNNDIIGERSDLISLTTDILDLWKKVKAPRYSGLPMPTGGVFDRFVAKAIEMSEDAFISGPSLSAPRV